LKGSRLTILTAGGSVSGKIFKRIHAQTAQVIAYVPVSIVHVRLTAPLVKNRAILVAKVTCLATERSLLRGGYRRLVRLQSADILAYGFSRSSRSTSHVSCLGSPGSRAACARHRCLCYCRLRAWLIVVSTKNSNGCYSRSKVQERCSHQLQFR
jgi:hypothetical protein